MRDDGEYVMHLGKEEVEEIEDLDGGNNPSLNEWEIQERVWRRRWR